MANFSKKQLRENMISRRSNLPQNEVDRSSLQVASHLTQLLPLSSPRVIMAYYPLGKEIDLTFWLKQYQKQGHTILLPRVEGKNLQAISFTGPENLIRSEFGVMEPEGLAYPLEQIEVVIVPGVAFDRNRYRLGFGQGYYDRFLPLLSPQTKLWGVAYHFQIVENIGHEAHDWPLQKIITDQLVF